MPKGNLIDGDLNKATDCADWMDAEGGEMIITPNSIIQSVEGLLIGSDGDCVVDLDRWIQIQQLIKDAYDLGCTNGKNVGKYPKEE
jgi:hypothetical protein